MWYERNSSPLRGKRWTIEVIVLGFAFSNGSLIGPMVQHFCVNISSLLFALNYYLTQSPNETSLKTTWFHNWTDQIKEKREHNVVLKTRAWSEVRQNCLSEELDTKESPWSRPTHPLHAVIQMMWNETRHRRSFNVIIVALAQETRRWTQRSSSSNVTLAMQGGKKEKHGIQSACCDKNTCSQHLGE